MWCCNNRTSITCAAKRLRDHRGQATVELAIAFPVIIIVAVIAVNTLLLFGECSAFDRTARQAIRTYACSPSAGEGSAAICGHIQAALDDSFDAPYMSCSVEGSGAQYGFMTYRATLQFYPTLFGLGLKEEVFGIPLPQITHSVELTVDSYKPGVLF